MAIPRFISFLRRRQYPGVIVSGLPAINSTLSIDMNSLFHTAAQQTYSYENYADPNRWLELEKMDPAELELELFKNIGIRLLNIITTVSPTDAVVLCVDGLAPVAKMQQQRQRRYRSKVKTREELEKISTKAPKLFDSNAITPGTEFMQRLDKFLQGWIFANRMKLPPMIRYSSYLESGEGEHKIFDMIRRSLNPDTLAEDSAKSVYDPRKVHIIYGLDADLVMLATMCPLDRIHLMREDVGDVVDIGNFRRAIKFELRSETSIPDFIIMMYLLGNDFLPHHPGFEDFDVAVNQLFEVYNAVDLPLTQGDNILFDNLNIFFGKLAEVEPSLMEQVAKTAVKYPSRMINAATDPNSGNFNFGRFRSAWYLNELSMKGRPDFIDQIWNKFGLQTDLKSVNPDEIVRMCETYLTGLAWVFRYYNRGSNGINDKYQYPFFHCPLITDLNGVLKQIKVDTDSILPEPGWQLLIPHQLLFVMPPQSINLIPNEIKSLYDVDSPLADIFPINFMIEKDGKNETWLFLPLVPQIDMYRVISAVDGLKLDINILLKYAEVKTLQINAIEGGTRYNEQRKFRSRINEIVYGSATVRAPGRGRGRGEGRSRGRPEGRGRGRGGSVEGRGQSRGGRSRPEGRGRGRGGRGRERTSTEGRGRERGSVEGRGRSRGSVEGRGREQIRTPRAAPRETPRERWENLEPLV